MTKEDKSSDAPVEFWEEEQEGQVYIKPRLDMKLTPRQKQECRDIVLEIRKFGCNSRQKLFLIELLALECEDNNLLRNIKAAVEESREKFGQQETGLIIPGRTE